MNNKKSIKKLIRLLASVAATIIIFVFSGLLSWLLEDAPDWVVLTVNGLIFVLIAYALYDKFSESGRETSSFTDEKISLFLTDRYSMFHADLIQRAMFDDSIDKEAFMRGIYLIDESFRSMDDNDEYVPDGWEGTTA